MTSVVVRTAGLLVLSNLFMTFAWYGHLKNLGDRPWFVAAVVSWGIAISVFVPFAVYYMKQPIKLDFLWAALCLLGAVYFVFRGTATTGFHRGGTRRNAEDDGTFF